MVKIETIHGVGTHTKNVFNAHHIFTTNDLINFYPKKYERYYLLNYFDRSNHEQIVTIKALVITELVTYKSNKTNYLVFEIEFNGAAYKVIAFNQSFLVNTIKLNDEYLITGKLNYYRKEIVLSKLATDSFNPFKPIYNIEPLHDTNVSKIISEIITKKQFEKDDVLPNYIACKYNLINDEDFLNFIHNPKSEKELSLAINKIKHKEAYLFQKEMLDRVDLKKPKEAIKYNLSKVREFIETLPYELTNDQKMAVNDIFTDFKSKSTESRLIQGDVGSGKTLVAAVAIFAIIDAGYQVALMAPTEILAKQHFDSINSYLKNMFKSVLLTSSTKEKEQVKHDIKVGKINFIVGTHAIAQDDVVFNNLKLTIIDEQHKFGVSTRNDLIKKGTSDLIYLTATPIPRTLAITMFSSSNVSVIREKPKNRIKVITKNFHENEIETVIEKIKETISKDEKVFVVVPAIESNHAKYNTNNVYRALKKRMPNYKDLYMIHGNLNKLEQEKVIENFKTAKTAILVATSMIEVGIDVEKATLIVIFSANFFGLSQLHQLRGRVGRGSLQSYCYLVSDEKDNERLKLLTSIDDGFILSEHDLKLRGPGVLLGYEQTGKFNFKYLNFFEDFEILKNIRTDIINDSKNMI